ncbi:MAG: glycosyltransferase family 2 protein [Armatimonadota bacterium]
MSQYLHQNGIPEPPSVGALIIAWNRRDDVLDCIGSLKRSGYPKLWIYVVDNASSDGTSEAIEKQFPDAVIIRSETNLGFAGGNNLGLKSILADGLDAVFLLNDDAVVSGDAVGTLVNGGYHDDSVGVLAPKILLYSDPEIVWSSGGDVDPHTGVTYQRNFGKKDNKADTVSEIDYSVGCAMLIKSEVIRQVGMIDERYFTYYEETDWCRRIRNAGYRILYIPESRVLHKVPLVVNNRNNAAYYYTRNRLLYLNTTGVSSVKIARVTSSLIKTAISHSIKGRAEEGKLMLKGVIHYYKGQFGRLGGRA